jgi:hypothetical protein
MPIDARKVVLAPEGGAPTPTGVAINGMRLGFLAGEALDPKMHQIAPKPGEAPRLEGRDEA